MGGMGDVEDMVLPSLPDTSGRRYWHKKDLLRGDKDYSWTGALANFLDVDDEGRVFTQRKAGHGQQRELTLLHDWQLLDVPEKSVSRRFDLCDTGRYGDGFNDVQNCLRRGLTVPALADALLLDHGVLGSHTLGIEPGPSGDWCPPRDPKEELLLHFGRLFSYRSESCRRENALYSVPLSTLKYCRGDHGYTPYRWNRLLSVGELLFMAVDRRVLSLKLSGQGGGSVTPLPHRFTCDTEVCELTCHSLRLVVRSSKAWYLLSFEEESGFSCEYSERLDATRDLRSVYTNPFLPGEELLLAVTDDSAQESVVELLAEPRRRRVDGFRVSTTGDGYVRAYHCGHWRHVALASARALSLRDLRVSDGGGRRSSLVLVQRPADDREDIVFSGVFDHRHYIATGSSVAVYDERYPRHEAFRLEHGLTYSPAFAAAVTCPAAGVTSQQEVLLAGGAGGDLVSLRLGLSPAPHLLSVPTQLASVHHMLSAPGAGPDGGLWGRGGGALHARCVGHVSGVAVLDSSQLLVANQHGLLFRSSSAECTRSAAAAAADSPGGSLADTPSPAHPDFQVADNQFLVDQSDGVADNQFLVDQSDGVDGSTVTDGNARVDGSAAVVDGSAAVVDESPAVVDSNAVVDGSAAMVDESPAMVDGSAAVTDGNAMVDGSAAVVDGSAAGGEQELACTAPDRRRTDTRRRVRLLSEQFGCLRVFSASPHWTPAAQLPLPRRVEPHAQLTPSLPDAPTTSTTAPDAPIGT